MGFVKYILALLLVAGCGDGGDGGESLVAVTPSVRTQLESSVSSGATTFDFAAADPAFAWDRMHVFAPYRSRAVVEKELGFAWDGFDNTTIESSDSVTLIVFVRNGKVVHWYEQPCVAADLARLNNGKGYARAEAKFAIEHLKDQKWTELKPIAATTSPAAAQ